jgi:ribonucleoside-diphosphate reductase alpha chain
VPLRDLVNKFTHVRFEPSGFTGNPEVPIAKSIVDYIFRWMGSRFLSKDDRDALGILGGEIVSTAPFEATPQLGAFDASVGPASDSIAAAAPPVPSTSSGGEGGDRPLGLGSTAASNGSAANVGDAANGSSREAASVGAGQRIAFSVSADSPSCMDCGSIMVRNGSCYKCLNCGSTSGCS